MLLRKYYVSLKPACIVLREVTMEEKPQRMEIFNFPKGLSEHGKMDLALSAIRKCKALGINISVVSN